MKLLSLLIIATLMPAVSAGGARVPSQESSSKQPPDSPADKKHPVKGAESSEADPQTTASAAEDIDVGNFYLHKGDVDAAIDRYHDAIQAQPNLGKPRLLIAEAYERKRDSASAVKYYKEYLQVFPHAPDAKKIQGKIKKLSE